jgi:hypothetical protein
MLSALTNLVFRAPAVEGALVVPLVERTGTPDDIWDGSASPLGAVGCKRMCMCCGSIVRSVSMKAAAVNEECFADREGTSAILL